MRIVDDDEYGSNEEKRMTFAQSTFQRPARRQARTTVTRTRSTAAPKGATAGRDIEVVITPENYERRIDKRGRPYAWVRGSLVHRNVEMLRTVMVQGEAYALIEHLLGVGTSLKISGCRENIVDKATGRIGGEIFRAKDVLKVYDAQGRELDGTTGRVLVGHEREGHYRRQHYGPGNSLTKIIWVDEVKINGGSAAAKAA